MRIKPQVWFQRDGGFKPYRIEPIRNGRLFCKPKGGLWTSTLDVEAEWFSDWHEQGYHMFGKGWFKTAWLLTPRDSLKVFVIDTLNDLKRFWKKYNYIETDLKGLSTSLLVYKQPYDFVSFFEEYDALQLTEKGQWRTRLTYPLNLYGWDSESILWDSFDSFHRATEIPANSHLGRQLQRINDRNG